MKIKRFIAKNMREAIRLVREEQGPEAVILSNRRVGEGIEVVAATDYDAALMHQALRAPTPPPPAAAAAAPQAPARIEACEPPPAAVRPEPALSELRRELGGMRKMLEQQLGGLLWRDLKTHKPVQLAVLRALAGLGIEPELARKIVAEIPEGADHERARFLPLGLLARRIPVVKREPIHDGGVIALVGPTGVGKTTTIAKLAARFARIHGLRDVALVSTDHYRIGAQEQLHTYGRLLGVPVLSAATGAELAQALDKLKDRKLVLIDTAGMSQRDRNLEAQFATLSGVPHPIRSYLVLAANAQAQDLDEVVRKFSAAQPQACILTKLDEATRIGGALSVAIRHQLPLAYLTDGQRVPEDLQPARSDQLVIRAMQLARLSPAAVDDDALALQFGDVAHAHA